jgi:hypothetical protein
MLSVLTSLNCPEFTDDVIIDPPAVIASVKLVGCGIVRTK